MFANSAVRVRCRALLFASIALLVSAIVFPAPTSAQTPATADTSLDVTGNGVVNDVDAGQVISVWSSLQEQGQCTIDGAGALDFSGNGCIDVADVQRIAAKWGTSAKPGESIQNAPEVSATASNEYVVNSTGDESDATPGDGTCATGTTPATCTLRAAIEESNAHGGLDYIKFNITNCPTAGSCPASGPLVIQGTSTLSSQLIVDDKFKQGAIIDGYTQPGSSPNTLAVGGNANIRIELVGTSTQGVNGLTLSSPKNVVRGLSIYKWNINLVINYQSATQNVVAGNFIGTNAANTFGLGSNTQRLDGEGLRLAYTNPDGVSPDAINNIIGGATPADRNIIGGNLVDGIAFYNDVVGTKVIGNYIGLRQDGRTKLPNRSDGVDVNSGSHDNIIGGSSVGERNVISGNNSDGIEISHSNEGRINRDNKIVGNYIGVSAFGDQMKNSDGTQATLGNGNQCVTLEETVTRVEVYGNVLANCGNNGVRLWTRITDSSIHDNWIGVVPSSDADGVPSADDGALKPFPNGVITDATKTYRGQHGVYIMGDSKRNSIFRNVIAYNVGYGILVSNIVDNTPGYGGNLETDYNTISRNTIYSNGVGFKPDGPKNHGIVMEPIRNDSTGQLDYPNLGIKPPTITKAYQNLVSGTACNGCTVEVFIAQPNADDDAGQGKVFLGAGVVGSNGQFTISVSGVSANQLVTATMTDTEGNTSAFATNKTVQAGNDPNPPGTPVPTPPPPAVYQIELPLVQK